MYNYDLTKSSINLPIKLKLGTNEIDFVASLDTGATFCIFERLFGEEIGLIIEQGHKTFIRTALGKFTAYGHTVTMDILDYSFESFVYFAENESFSHNVLGRNGFLSKINLGLIDYDGKIFLNSYDTDIK